MRKTVRCSSLSARRAALAALLAAALLAPAGCGHHPPPVANTLADTPLTPPPLRESALTPTQPTGSGPAASTAAGTPAEKRNPDEYHVVDALTVGFNLTMDYRHLAGDGNGHVVGGEVRNLRIEGLPIDLASNEIKDGNIRTVPFGDFLLTGNPPRVKMNMTDNQINKIKAYLKAHPAPKP
jgi:hypothetical protein